MEVYPPVIVETIDFTVDRLTVASEHHKNFFIESGYPAEGIEVVGKLNSDYWFNNYWKSREMISPVRFESQAIYVFLFWT